MRRLARRGLLALVIISLTSGCWASPRPDAHSAQTPPGSASTGSGREDSPRPSVTIEATEPEDLEPLESGSQPLVLVTSPPELSQRFTDLRAELGVRSIGLVALPVGEHEAIAFGDWRSGPAWSTIKVPLSLASERALPGATTASLVHRAITVSDNAAAEALWARFGSGSAAAAATTDVLRRYGDTVTNTQAVQVRPPYSPFGQTNWSLVEQAGFASHLVCSGDGGRTVAAMASISADQRWGLGRIDGAVYKGGWGPTRSGAYLVRQFGVVPIAGRPWAIALAVVSTDGTFGSATRALDVLARWLPTGLHGIDGIATAETRLTCHAAPHPTLSGEEPPS